MARTGAKGRIARALQLAVCLGISTLAACASTAATTPHDGLPTAAAIKPTPTAAIAIPRPSSRTFTFRVINTYPHDRQAFTQGLVLENDIMYEGTGLRGRSTLRKVELETGNVLQTHKLPDQLFGEGITVFGERIYQLTWQSGIGFVYDKNSFELLREFRYPTEGWGITHDGNSLIMSDGTSTLRFLDPDTLEEISQIEVRDRGRPVTRLNELEYVRGEIYANVWQTDHIVRIEPDTGEVTGWIELTGILSPQDRTEPVDVLNGIAYAPENDRLFVTGKLWPRLFEIELVPLE